MSLPPRIVLVGHPNVGKSQLFNLLTGSSVTVSNYPGTTVELARGRGKLGDREAEVLDTPGLYSLSALSPEEQVTRLLLLRAKPALVIQVIDARNLPRMLSLTLELIEAGLPLVIALNMMDEAKASGLKIDSELLARRLGVAVVPTILVAGHGLKQLHRAAAAAAREGAAAALPFAPPLYPPELEAGLARAAARLRGGYGLSARAVAMAMFHPDPVLEEEIKKREGFPEAAARARKALGEIAEPLLGMASARRACSDALLKGVIRYPVREPFSLAERLGKMLLHPAGGTLFLATVLYFGFYRFVGGFGAGTLVELLEQRLFLAYLAPLLDHWAGLYLPWEWLRDLLVRDYGIFTLGLRYTFAIILPIMATFFLFFGVVEDSGYLPRASFLVNFLLEKIGLNGKAVIPLTLGFGCGTLAVLVTRTLETRRERLQAALLLSLAVPCSAQLGLILALLSRGAGLLIWSAVVAFAFGGAALAGRLLLGRETAPFCLEIPPLRLPRPGAILRKTAARLRWYLREVLPLFAGISVLMWILHQTGLFGRLIDCCRPLAATLGLPGETALVFVYGFLRRDYGAAGLFDLARAGVLNPGQVLTAAVVLTLFLPCIAQLTVLVREHGAGFAFLVAVLTALAAWAAGLLVSLLAGLPLVANMLA